MPRQYIKKSRKSLINKGKTDIRGYVLHKNFEKPEYDIFMFINKNDNMMENRKIKASKIVNSVFSSEIKEYCIYYLIMFLCIFIRWIPMSSGNANVDSVINDIVIGGFSSTFVALLIARHDNNKDARERQKIYNRVTESFYSELFQYLAIMELEFFNRDLTDLKKCNAISSEIFDGEDWAAGVSQWTYLVIVGMQDHIAEKADKILEQEFDLINERIISEEDIDSIRGLRRCIIKISEETEKLIEKTWHWPKLVIRHDHLVNFLKKDIRFTDNLVEIYPSYYKKYRYGTRRGANQVFIEY